MTNTHEALRKPGELLSYRQRLGSLDGETGILIEILRRIDETDHWCVEFGTLDGIQFSNTLHLVDNFSYKAVYIEGDLRHFETLRSNMRSRNVACINAFVTPDGQMSLDSILSNTGIPTNFDLLVVDVDNNDYHILKGIIKYRPKVVMVEINNTLLPHDDKIAVFDAPFIFGEHGTSIKSMTEMMRSKGYKLVANVSCNAIYVDSLYYKNIFEKDFEIRDFYTYEGIPMHVCMRKLSVKEILTKLKEAFRREASYGVNPCFTCMSIILRMMGLRK